MDQFNFLKQFSQETKQKLNTIEFEVESGQGLIVLTMNANKKIKSLKINADLTHMDKEDLEDLLTIVVERGLTRAEEISEQELKKSLGNILPGL